MQVKATCGICQGNCKVVLTVEDGKIIKVEPDRESPRGRACFRGVHAPDILYGEQRLKKPSEDIEPLYVRPCDAVDNLPDLARRQGRDSDAATAELERLLHLAPGSEI